jgi:hypothetical protein
VSEDLISREALIKKIFAYGMPDDGNYPINAKAVMEAIMEVEAVDKKQGYTFKTEYMTFAQLPNGHWSPVYSTRTKDNQEVAEIQKNKYIDAVKKDPHLYPGYRRFKIMKRTADTSFGEWENV